MERLSGSFLEYGLRTPARSLLLCHLPTDACRASLLLGRTVALRHRWATGWVARSLLSLSSTARLTSLAVYPAFAFVLAEPLLKPATCVCHTGHVKPFGSRRRVSCIRGQANRWRKQMGTP